MKQTINIGTAANDGTGDALRTAMDKVNDNFSEIYSTGGDSLKIKFIDALGTAADSESAITIILGITPAQAGAGYQVAIRYQSPSQYYLSYVISDGVHWYIYPQYNMVLR